MRDESARSRGRFAGLVSAAFVLLTVPRLLRHELWRDEAWLWLVVTESASLDDLFTALDRNGQGYLFALICLLARHASTSPQAMQLANLLLASAAAFAFARWAPFPRWERALFVLGYFPFYEYAVISRPYAAGALLLWLACVAAVRHRPLALGAALGLLCQTTVYGYILAVALAVGWTIDRWLRRNDVPPLPRGAAAAGLGLGLAGAVAGIVQLMPEPGTSFVPQWRFFRDQALLEQVLTIPWRASIPLPQPALHFWDSNALDEYPRLLMWGGLGMLALLGTLLGRRAAALTSFGLGVAGLLAFAYVKYVGVLRHHGHLWLLFVATLWMSSRHDVLADRSSWRTRVLLALFVAHAGAAAFASWMDLRHPFSNGAATAAFLRAEGLDRHPLLGYREPPAATVALVLGRPLYAPSRGRYTTHPDWGPMQRDLSPAELRCAARALARDEGQDIVLVMNRELPPWGEVAPAGARLGAIVPSEDYYLYWLRHGLLESTAAAAGCEGAVSQDAPPEWWRP